MLFVREDCTVWSGNTRGLCGVTPNFVLILEVCSCFAAGGVWGRAVPAVGYGSPWSGADA